MVLNLNKAQVNDTAIMRNGGKSVITRIELSNKHDGGWYVCFDGCAHGISLNKSGRLISYSNGYKPVAKCPFDIVEIKAKRAVKKKNSLTESI